RARLKARMYLVRAVTLAPECAECRRELFDLLLSSDGSSSALRQAELLLGNMPESDPECASMRSVFAEARKQRFSPESLTMAILGSPSRTVTGLCLRPVPTLTRQSSEPSLAREIERDSNRRTLLAGE